MKVIIVGCGQVGATLAYQLAKMTHQVVVIDQDENALDHLPEDFQGRIVQGDVLTKTVLHRAEVNGADALFALTNLDPLNALIAHIAQSEYLVPIVAARNNDRVSYACNRRLELRLSVHRAGGQTAWLTCSLESSYRRSDWIRMLKWLSTRLSYQ